MNGIIPGTRNGQGADPVADARGETGRGQGSAPVSERKPDIDIRTGRAFPTVASFFSGVGGLDLGLELAGMRVVSNSEIDPFASAVLKTRWPSVPNIGDIVELAERVNNHTYPSGERWQHADVFIGGFPCQDLSIAGQRGGLRDDDGNLTRSGLALAFLRLVEEFTPKWFILENVTGLLSSNEGRDLQELLREVRQLGYGWSYRVLNSAYFGVPQRRRRVYLVAAFGDLDGSRTRKVLRLGDFGGGHPAESEQAREDVAGPIEYRATGSDFAARTIGPLTVGDHIGIQPNGQDAYTGQLVVSPKVDPSGAGAASRLPRWLDYSRPGPVAATPFRKVHRAQSREDYETWAEAEVANTLNTFDVDTRDTHAIVQRDLMPEGYDTRRFKAMGNAVSVPVAYWLGRHLIEQMAEDTKASRLRAYKQRMGL